MKCEEARTIFSEFLERYLADHKADLLTAHLAECQSCRDELAELEETLCLMHGLPRQEPVLDLWKEFVPRLAEVRAELRLSPFRRARLHFVRFLATLAEGWALYRAALSYHLSQRFQRVGVEDVE